MLLEAISIFGYAKLPLQSCSKEWKNRYNKQFVAGSKKELIVIETSKKNRSWEDTEILIGNIFVHVSSDENYPRKIDFISHFEDKGMKD
jgi:hypothetical protein